MDPQSAFFLDQKHWMPEGIGIETDITVMDDPAKMRGGKDPQLDAAIHHLMSEFKRFPPNPTAPTKAVRHRGNG